MRLLAIYAAALNLAAFGVSAWDKHSAARHRKRRVRERTLFLLALAGGSAGLYASMLLLRHKTKHWYFMLGVPLILAAQVVLVLWLYFLKPL